MVNENNNLYFKTIYDIFLDLPEIRSNDSKWELLHWFDWTVYNTIIIIMTLIVIIIFLKTIYNSYVNVRNFNDEEEKKNNWEASLKNVVIQVLKDTIVKWSSILFLWALFWIIFTFAFAWEVSAS